MKAFNEFAEKQFQRAGLILLFDGEVGCRKRQPRRAQLNRYPDFGFNLAPAFPIPTLRAQWLWEFVSRYSGATVPDSHGVPGHLAATFRISEIRLFQRAASLLFLLFQIAKNNFVNTSVSKS